MASKKKQPHQTRHPIRTATTERPLISVCMIVRDEEENLPRCLASLRSAADELVVVDTGSRDRTVEIARKFGAKVSHFPWCDDFAAARNAALERATGQWILQMDADEELAQDGARKVRQLARSALPQCWGFYLPVRCYYMRDGQQTHTIAYRPLLFRNHPDQRYRARIHEHIAYQGTGSEPDFGLTDEVAIEHHGYLPDQMEAKNKDERNMRLLQLSVIEEPDDPYHLYNLGKQHYVMERFAEAVGPLEQAAALCKDPSAYYLPENHALLVVALSRVGRGAEVPAMIAEAERRVTDLSANFYCNAGSILYELGRAEEAVAAFERAIAAGSARIAVQFDPGAHTWLPRLGLGIICEERGEFARAQTYYKEALSHLPGDPKLNHRLAVLELRMGDRALALRHVKDALKAPTVPDKVLWSLLQVCEDLADAESPDGSALAELPGVAAELVLRIPISAETGARLSGACGRFEQWERGIAAASATLEQREDTLARVNRGSCYFALGRYQEAEEDFAAGQAGEIGDAGSSSARGTAAPERPAPPPGSLEEALAVLTQQEAAYAWMHGVGNEEDLGTTSSAPVPSIASPLVSIVLPAFDNAENTRRCLEAIVENTPEDLYEIVIIDNSSTADTKEFLKQLSGDLKVITNETNLGVAKSWEQGAQTASGKYLAFLTDDAPPQEGWLDGLVSLIESDPSIGGVTTQSLHSPREAERTGEQPSSNPQRHKRTTAKACSSQISWPGHSAARVSSQLVLITRLAWEAVGGADNLDSSAGNDVPDVILAVQKAGCRVESLPDSGYPPVQSATSSNESPEQPSYYSWSRPEIQALVPKSAGRILDVGCGNGALGKALKARQKCEVTGVEHVAKAADVASEVLDHVYVGDVAQIAPSLPNSHFDCVILADVLEHLYDPGTTLSTLRGKLAPGGRFILSIPNIRHWSVLRGLLEGRWDYADAGLLDRTHLRFFTRRTFEELLQAAGLRPLAINATGIEGESMPTSLVNALGSAGIDVSTLLEESRIYQFLYVAEPITQASTPPLTSIIILTHNQFDHTRLCLESLERHTPEPHEIIVVDNGSTDDTLDYLQSYMLAHDNVRVLSNGANLGFAAGNNQGLALARGEYVLLLNNDTIVTKGWLGRMLSLFQQYPKVGIAGPMSNYVSGPQLVSEVNYKSLSGIEPFAARWSAKHARQSLAYPRVVGFCLMARRAVVDRIGGLDEQFGSGNFEDDDFCIRAALAGFEARIAQDVFIHHTGSQTFNGAGIDWEQSMRRNWKLFKAKWGIPEDRPLDQGYNITVQTRDLARFFVPLPHVGPELQLKPGLTEASVA